VAAPVAPVEVAWFAALCDDDSEQLGVAAAALPSSYAHCREIVLAAERGGFDNCLLPSGYALGIDSVAFAGGVAPSLTRMSLLVAVRCGELWPPMLARQGCRKKLLIKSCRALAARITVSPGTDRARHPWLYPHLTQRQDNHGTQEK
jgi:hypothetical protein